MLTSSMLLTAGDEEFCIIARKGVGLRYLQTLFTPENRKLCQNMISSILSTDPLRMMTNPSLLFPVPEVSSRYYLSPSNLWSWITTPGCQYARLPCGDGHHQASRVASERGLYLYAGEPRHADQLAEEQLWNISSFNSFCLAM